VNTKPLLPSKYLLPDTDTCSADVSGEQIRRNLTESERGIPLTLDFQVVDSKTCKPLKDVAVDIWGCNTTVSSEKSTTQTPR
jgi:protocatechuate 3,4-dioxygenase beta subunit